MQRTLARSTTSETGNLRPGICALESGTEAIANYQKRSLLRTIGRDGICGCLEGDIGIENVLSRKLLMRLQILYAMKRYEMVQTAQLCRL